MEKVRKMSKKYYLRQVVACWLMCWMVFGTSAAMAVTPPPVGTLPQNPTVTNGSVGDFDYVVNNLDITEVAHKTIIEWDSFSIGGDALTEFHFQNPGINPAVLNRIMLANPSLIFGQLKADGRVFIVNPAGIVFGNGARVNVTQLVASSLKLDDADFLNGAPYHFYDGAAAGEVRNESLDTLTAELIYLIGKHVINTGSLRALDGYVVMAAGDTVTISEVGSAVAVEVTLPPLVDTSEYLVDHHGGADGRINAQHVILAAGDIWASAYIKASSNGGSDAVATVLIDADGDIDIDGEITAEAEATGGGDNAFATVTIDAGGDVTINDYIEAEADAEDGAGNATADIDISAIGSVTVNSSVDADAWVDENSGDATATLNITSLGGDVDIYDDVSAEADTRDGSGNAVAKTEITAHGDVDISGRFRARSEAVDSGNATADTIITAEDIVINQGGNNTAIITRAITNSNTVNTGDAVGNTVIAAREDVTVNGSIKTKVSSNDAGNATSDIKISGVDIDINAKVISRTQAGFHYLGEYESEDGYSGDATSGIDITASGIVNVDDVVKSNAEAENNSGSASATTKIVGTEVNIQGGEDTTDRHDNDVYQSVVAFANTYDNSGNATANVELEATTGDVIIDTDEYPVMAKAGVEDPASSHATAGVTITAAENVQILSSEVKAEATTYTMLEPDPGMLVDGVINLTVSGHVATATVDITATNGEVEIIGNSEAQVEAIAKNEVEIDIDGSRFKESEFTVNLTMEDLVADAGVTISAGDDVEVIGDDGDAKVKAEAKNEFEAMGYSWEGQDVTFNLTVDNLASTADVDITATDDVKVMAFNNNDEADIEVRATTELDDETEDFDVTEKVDNIVNTADITINAGDDVKVMAFNGGEADVGAKAENKGEVDENPKEYGTPERPHPENWVNNATIDITAGDEVKVMADDYGSGDPSEAKIEAETEQGTHNTSSVVINAGGDVKVFGKESGYASILAKATGGDEDIDTDNIATIENIANVTITTVGGDVLVHGIGGAYHSPWVPSHASIEALAEVAGSKNTANVTIKATATASEYPEGEYVYVEVEGGDVKVIGVEGGEAEITAIAKDADGDVLKVDDLPVDGPSNTANIHIHATGVELVDVAQIDDEFVYVDDGDTFMISGDVEVKALGNGSGPDSEASIKAVTVKGFSNNSDVLICAEDVEVVGGTENKERGEAEILALAHKGHLNDAYVGINAGGSLTVSSYKGDASIESIAMMGHTNTAYTLICAEDVLVEALKRSESRIAAEADDGKLNTADIDIISRGDVEVTATKGGDAEIEAGAEDGRDENNAHVGIWADGDVLVTATRGGEAEIEAGAENDCEGTDNTADVTVVAGGDISVTATSGGDAEIAAEAEDGSNLNNAYVGLWADGGVMVTARRGGNASIEAEAKDGIDNIAKVAVCAEGDVIVASGFNPDDVDVEQGIPDGSGGSATIRAEAQADSHYAGDLMVETSATAEVKVVSHGGGVAVVDITDEGRPQTATIEAEAHGAYSNTADVGVAAGGELMDGMLTEDSTLYDVFNGLTGLELNDELGLGVLVAGLGYNSKASIFAYAYDGAENTADTVVCAPEIVAVVAYADNGGGSKPFAQIKSRAGAYFGGDGDATNTATTQVYAGDVAVYVPTIARGRGIWASAVGTEGMPHVDSLFLMTEYDDEFGDGKFVWTIDNFSEDGDDSATLIIDTYDNADDCPTCDPRPLPPDCPTCEEEPFGPPAPFPDLQLPLISGCPAETQAAAGELGITPETIQVSIANALALNPDIHPCQACARLIDAARILSDEDGSLMAAAIQAFNTLAPADAPFTPEMGASIAMTFEAAAAGTQYASVAGYIDAFVDYVTVLETELGAPVGDSTVFAMEKYGAGIAENANIVAYIEARLAGL